jgi:phosphoglycerate dehydrogenase-like enzyme
MAAPPDPGIPPDEVAKVLVTPRSVTRGEVGSTTSSPLRGGHPALQRLRDAGYEVVFCTPGIQPGEDELMSLLPGCVGYLAGVEPIPARVLDSAKDLRAISRNGTGTDSIDLDAAARLGISVLRAEGANARGVAELTIGLVLGLARSIPFSDANLKRGSWERRKGIEVQGKTLGLIGCGRIGRLVAEMALAMGMTVVAFDPCADDSFRPGDRFRYGDLGAVLSESDVISLHCPAGADGRPVIDAGAIQKMKRGVYLVNTARGGLLDGDAVLDALSRGRIAGVAVDAYVKEPPGDDPLVRHSRVIATPHTGAYTDESVDRAVEQAVDNLLVALLASRASAAANE